MASLAQTTLLSPVVRLLPNRLLAMLDAWSHRLALQRVRERREAAERRTKARPGRRAG
jgi:hypothetical protein